MQSSLVASRYAEGDVLVSSDSAVSGPSSCCVSSLSSSALLASAHRRCYNALPLPLPCFSPPKPCGVEPESCSTISLASIGGLVGELLALLRTTEYDVYHVQCVATEAMACLQMVHLHLIERTLMDTVGLVEALPLRGEG
ncbi:hypothetical protein NXY56_003069 [Leishmania guyanensis]|uniref:Uncharacterized protein n=1 Tax=Leishmania shawi TaxID=5680 RepID=A0AAW3BV11_9TRYP